MATSPNASDNAAGRRADPRLLRIGTRGSPLALAQAKETKERLLRAHAGLTDASIEIVPIATSGDRLAAVRPAPATLGPAGVKGLFTKEIEEALAAGLVDVAVHSMKDLPADLALGLVIACLLPREDPRDVLLTRPRPGQEPLRGLRGLPQGAVVGTSSLRRRAQVLSRRPDLKVVDFRGNVQTRLAKLEAGRADATLLALAGLNRLGLRPTDAAVLEPEELLPAAAQGAIGIQCRGKDTRVQDLLAPLNHPDTEIAVRAERAVLAALEGSCNTPIAALARRSDGGLWLRAAIFRPDGSEVLETSRNGAPSDAAQMGRDAGGELRTRAGPGFFDFP